MSVEYKPFLCDTIETCDGLACRKCKLSIDLCFCNPKQTEDSIRAALAEAELVP
jgi:hypothetical protein